MTTQEFSIEFDILYNNLASNAAPPLNEYEKSVFLTKAQSDIVMELYSGRNQLGLSYESNEEVKRYLAPLGVQKSVEVKTGRGDSLGLCKKCLLNIDISNFITITREEVTSSTQYIKVVPVAQDDIASIINNPFRGPISNKRFLRLTEENSLYLVVPSEDDASYTYSIYGLKKPSPIILEICGIAEGDLSIEGTDAITSQTSELPEILHKDILNRAVLLAKQAYIGGQAQA